MSSTGDEVDWIHNGDDLCFHGTWAEKKEADRLRESVSKQNARRHPDPEAEEREKEERERKEVYRTLRQRKRKPFASKLRKKRRTGRQSYVNSSTRARKKGVE